MPFRLITVVVSLYGCGSAARPRTSVVTIIDTMMQRHVTVLIFNFIIIALNRIHVFFTINTRKLGTNGSFLVLLLVQLLKGLLDGLRDGGLDTALGVVNSDYDFLDSRGDFFSAVRNDNALEDKAVGFSEGLELVGHGDGVGELDGLCWMNVRPVSSSSR